MEQNSSNSSQRCYLPLRTSTSPLTTSIPSPTLEWVNDTENAIKSYQRKLDEPQLQSSPYYKHKSESQLNDSTINTPKNDLKSPTCSSQSKPRQLAASGLKPILKTGPSKHKRCSSLGQNIRYIDETQPSLFTPLTCPSTPNAVNLQSSNCNCNHCNCNCNKSVPLLASNDDDESEAWIPKGHDPYRCSFCGCPYKDPKCLSIDRTLVPPLASAEQLSIFDYPSDHAAGDNLRYNINENADRQSLYSIHMEKDFR